MEPMFKIVMLIAISGVALAGCSAKPGKGEPGAALLDSRCGRCHPTGISKAHSTREEWGQTVNKMIAKGAALNAEEKAVLVDFLVKYYHP